MSYFALIDYKMGNLSSVNKALESAGASVRIVTTPAEAQDACALVLPGVGSFGDAMANLNAAGWSDFIRNWIAADRPFLGICLGMQMLLEKSYEYGEHEGLGLIPGTIRPIAEAIPEGYKIPHIGWNALSFPEKKHPVFADIQEGDHVYFVHSFHGTDCEKYTAATTEYGGILTAAVAKDNVVGCQFYPEKSGSVGLTILKSFCNL